MTYEKSADPRKSRFRRFLFQKTVFFLAADRIGLVLPPVRLRHAADDGGWEEHGGSDVASLHDDVAVRLLATRHVHEFSLFLRRPHQLLRRFGLCIDDGERVPHEEEVPHADVYEIFRLH